MQKLLDFGKSQHGNELLHIEPVAVHSITRFTAHEQYSEYDIMRELGF